MVCFALSPGSFRGYDLWLRSESMGLWSPVEGQSDGSGHSDRYRTGCGAATALQAGTAAAVKDAYAQLRALVKKRLAGRSDGELRLIRDETAPKAWEEPLVAELSAAGAEGDAELVAAAQALMNLVDEAGSRSGKYAVTVRDSQGVQVGDRNTQTNTFAPGRA